MSGSRSRNKGARAERAVVAAMRDNGFPHAERRIAGMDDDTGDITNTGGLVVEVKDHARHDLAGWVDQMLAEVAQAEADHGVVVAKRRGHTDPADWYAVLPFGRFLDLARHAGYGRPSGGVE